MAIKIIDPVPSREVVKTRICRNCGVKLEFTPHDEKTGKSYDYTGSCDTYHFIPCPNCNNEVVTRNY